MRRKFNLFNRQLNQESLNSDTKDSQPTEYSNYKSNEQPPNELAKVYEINTHGKFTVIVRRSFIRLHIRPTTRVYPCFIYDLSSICSSEMFLKSNLSLNYYLRQNRKGKKKKLMHENLKTVVTTNKKSSTFIIQESTTPSHDNNYENLSSIIVHHEHIHHGFFAFIAIISIAILGLILWYVFIKPTQSTKSSIHPLSDSCDSDDSNDNGSLKRNRSTGSLLCDDNIDYLEKRLSNDGNYTDVKNYHQTIDQQNIRMLIKNLQQSDFESINYSTIGKVLADLIHNKLNTINEKPHQQSSNDLNEFLCEAATVFRVIRRIIIEKCSTCQSLNPDHFLQYRYLIETLQSSEFILEYLHEHYSDEKVFLIEVLTDLQEILSSMNNNSYKCQYICQSLFDILQKLNRRQNSYTY